jgi:type IV secretion system protein VirB10
VGTYDNSVSNGQDRVGVVWNRIIFPDTQSIQLGAMEGADQGGYAGFHDQVDTHFWSKLGSALLISIAGAGVQLAQPAAPVNGYYSPAQTGTSQVTQQLSQLGQEYARNGLSIPNTLEVRPGYSFVIMVAKDVRLPEYHDQRNIETAISLGPILQ